MRIDGCAAHGVIAQRDGINDWHSANVSSSVGNYGVADFCRLSVAGKQPVCRCANKIKAQRVANADGNDCGLVIDEPTAGRNGECASLRRYGNRSDVLSLLGRQPFVLRQNQCLTDVRQVCGWPLEQLDDALACDVIFVQQATPFCAAIEIGLDARCGSGTAVERIPIGKQRNRHVRIIRHIGHDDVAAQVGIGRVGLDAGENFAQIDPAPSAVKL